MNNNMTVLSGGRSQGKSITWFAETIVKEALTKIKEVEAYYENKIAKVILYAQINKMEMLCHKSITHDIYQFITGSTGEPGTWHGATPVKDEVLSIVDVLSQARCPHDHPASEDKNCAWCIKQKNITYKYLK